MVQEKNGSAWNSKELDLRARKNSLSVLFSAVRLRRMFSKNLQDSRFGTFRTKIVNPCLP